MNIIVSLNRWKRLLSFKSFDVQTSEGRSQERYRRLIWTVLSSVASRGIATLTSIISVPLCINYLGTERYGLWMTISSFIGMMAFADLGIGSGLLNALSEANGRDDEALGRRYISSAFYMLGGIAIGLFLLFMLFQPLISWPHVFNVSTPQAVREIDATMRVFIFCLLINLPLGVIQRIQMGYQEGAYNNTWLGVGNVLGLVGVLAVIQLRGGLPWLVTAMLASTVVATAINGLILFFRRRPALRPRWSDVDAETCKKIFKLGIFFLVLQLASSIGYQTDNLVLARLLGPEAVTQYSIPLKLFTIAPLLLSFVLMPLWPAYGEAIARGDTAWVKQTFRRSIVIGVCINMVPTLILIFFGVQIVHLWVGPEVTPSWTLRIGLGIWTLMNVVGGAVTALLNGMGAIRFQAVCAVLMGAASLIFSIALTQRIGIPGVIYGSVAAQILFNYLPIAFYMPRLLKRLA